MFVLPVSMAAGRLFVLQTGAARLVVASTRNPAGYTGHDTAALVPALAICNAGETNAHASA
jgi:hypothetical protein